MTTASAMNDLIAAIEEILVNDEELGGMLDLIALSEVSDLTGKAHTLASLSNEANERTAEYALFWEVRANALNHAVMGAMSKMRKFG